MMNSNMHVHVHTCVYNIYIHVYKYRLYTEANGSTGFIIPEDFMTSEGIIITVDSID